MKTYSIVCMSMILNATELMNCTCEYFKDGSSIQSCILYAKDEDGKAITPYPFEIMTAKIEKPSKNEELTTDAYNSYMKRPAKKPTYGKNGSVYFMEPKPKKIKIKDSK